MIRERVQIPPEILPESHLLGSRHREFRRRLQEFTFGRVAPVAAQYEAEGRFPRDILEEMGRLGYMGVPFPTEYGGMGCDVVCLAILIEELSRVWGSLGIILAAHIGLGSTPIWMWGTEDQKRKYLVRLARGEIVGAYGLTEPQAGSDSGATRTTAVLDGTHWVLNGTKCWCTNAGEAETYVVSAVTDPDKGKNGISAFIVERGTPGFSFGKKEDKMGLRSSSTGVLIFEDCRIPRENLLGQRGQGFKYFMQTLDGGRITIGAMALGLGQAALDAVARKLAGENLLGEVFEHEYRLAPLAEMGTEIAAARHMIYDAALHRANSPRWTMEGAMAKWLASEVAMRATSRALEMLGMEGLDSPVARTYLDAKLCTIGEGTNEIQRVVIAREMLRRL
ncbi:MAG TPA: acyl-CoA dehydrogenase family protein [Candidatus Nitrosotenuis sp.]|jgi:alkylation response protein AidB-like acyl-CoA dehydrogenase|nr:acyl-CoA dehydrogenase family protein [Candidatus Nitrosotenuis sp.]